MTPWPSLRSRAWSGAHMLLIKSSAWLQRQPRPRPGAGVSHTRSPCPTPGAPAQLGNKINPKVSMGAMREGGSKAKGPGRREGSSVPRRWGRAARVSSLPAPHPHPSPFQPPAPPESSPSSPTLPPLASPGAAQSSFWATSSSPSPGEPDSDPTLLHPAHRGSTRGGLRESLPLHQPVVGKSPVSLSLSFAICEMGAQGFGSIVLMFSHGTIPLSCDTLGQPRDTWGSHCPPPHVHGRLNSPKSMCDSLML